MGNNAYQNHWRDGSGMHDAQHTEHQQNVKNEVELQFGNYQIQRVIRRGTWTSIYQGEHILLHNKAVLKVLHNEVIDDTMIRHFYVEARLHASLLHPHIVRVLDFGMSENTLPFFVMDYAAQGSLQQYFPTGTALPAMTILPFVLQIADALQYLHDRNLIHRDLKPQNILVGAQHEALLTDFGITVTVQPWSMSKDQASIGTAMYAAPEQIQGHPMTASDQYALGVLVYTWLCGAPPFEGNSRELCRQHLYMKPASLRKKNPLITPEVERVVLNALAKDPYRRFLRIQDFALALEQAVQQEPATEKAGKVEKITEVDPFTPSPIFHPER